MDEQDILRLPRIDKDKIVYSAKLPKILKIEKTPWDSEVFEAEKTKVTDEQENPLDNVNAIRWRFVPGEIDEDGNPKKETNAKFVRWSDGTLSLMVGNDHVFDVETQTNLKGSSYLYSIVNTGSSLSCQSPLNHKMNFTPVGMKSSNHHNMNLKMLNQRVGPTNRIQTYFATESVEKEREKFEKELERQNRENKRLLRMKEKNKEKYYSSFNRRFNEQEDDEEEDFEEDFEDYNYSSERFSTNKRPREEDTNRILAAKSSSLNNQPKRKRRKIKEVDDIEIFDDSDDESSTLSGSLSSSSQSIKRGLILSDDESDDELDID
eukprot:TRINITY_DN294_c2_g1_i2.p1 TRINITY_DN294_c2_g1~~TRINITY_DN294_c2_g1_i2.p1  ORF type:complete len:337 (+),score=123.34 TRINITY_DN294_c2_g1_i2:51-1013(+)